VELKVKFNMNINYIDRLKCLILPCPKKLLFEHIPKCGGSTVNAYIKSQYLNKRVFSVNGNDPAASISYFKSLPEEKRYSFDLIHGHGADQLRDYSHPETLNVTIFRDPVERIISHYYYVLQSPKHNLFKEVTKKKLSLVDYASSDLSSELRNNYVTRFLRISAEEVERNPEQSIERAYRLIREAYGVTGTLDQLEISMNKVAKLLNFSNKFHPSRMNVTINRPGIDEIDQSVLDKIEKLNIIDVELYRMIKNMNR
jgi:hypothetical protein